MVEFATSKSTRGCTVLMCHPVELKGEDRMACHMRRQCLLLLECIIPVSCSSSVVVGRHELNLHAIQWYPVTLPTLGRLQPAARYDMLRGLKVRTFPPAWRRKTPLISSLSSSKVSLSPDGERSIAVGSCGFLSCFLRGKKIE